MNRFKVFMMVMNRFRLLLITAFIVAASVLFSGISVICAEKAPTTKNQTDEQKAAVAKKDAEAAVKARAARDAAVKRRHDASDYLKKVVEGQQQPGNKAGTGGAK